MLILSPQKYIDQYLRPRLGETKCGEMITHPMSDIYTLSDLDDYLHNNSSKYIILGIPEDVGVRANDGRAGAEKAYEVFLSYFLNIQVNSFLDIENSILLGNVYVEDIQISSQNQDIKTLREMTAEIDQRVSPIIQLLVKNKKTPIIIGGGHNNAYPIIQGVSQALDTSIEVLNIDPHLDCRAIEGRHSGNGFSYAYQSQYMSTYHVWGIHEMYNNQYMLDSVSSYTEYKTMEDILYRGVSFDDFILKTHQHIGVEVDLDSVKNMPTSAISPCGFTEEDIRRYLYQIRQMRTALYYHFPEGRPESGQEYKVGKFLTYLVADILKR